MIVRALLFFCLFSLKAEAFSEHLDVYTSIAAMIEARDGNVGKQLILDLYECSTTQLDDIDWVEHVMVEAAKRAQGHVVESSFHKFEPYGISGVVIIEESHIAIHIWPQYHYAAVDIFTCSDALGIKEASDYLISAFGAKKPIDLAFTRGKGITN